jgi:tetratricopeptide (TPR) repeat protein
MGRGGMSRRGGIGRTGAKGGMSWRRAMLVVALLSFLAPPALRAQHPAFRVKGRVVSDRGEPIANAAVRAEAFYGYAAGTFSGQRVFTAQTNGKGEWSIGAMQPGIWQFDVVAPGHLPEAVVLPIRILTTVSMGTSGMSLIWDLVLKPLRTPDDARGQMLGELTAYASDGKTELVRTGLERLPEDADADYLAGAGNVAMLAREAALARALYQRALERDPSSYRAARGVASIFLLQRDFDSASRAFDAARNRTHDKDELKFLSAAIGDLATVRVR